MKAQPIIHVANLVKSYKKSKQNAVDGISFDVDEGEFFAFLGPNGAGKTTTISILTTTLSKTSGDVEIAGFDLERQSSMVRQKIGVIFQNPSLDLNLTAEENIRFHAVLYGLYPFSPRFSWMPKAYQNKVMELAEVVDLKNDIFKPIKSFSGGMKRKLEIIRSLTHNPKVLFLDEPTSGLDPLSRKSLWSYLKEVREKEKTTIFLTTHYLDEAEGADRVCVINKGTIISLGTPSQIKKTFIKRFLLIDAKPREKLLRELDAMHVKYTLGDGVEVPIVDGQAQRILQKVKTKLSMIQIHNPTLEEAYIEMIGGENAHA